MKQACISVVLIAGVLAGQPVGGNSQSGQTPPQAGIRALVVISEVLFDPPPGDPPFVELLNAGSTPADLAELALRIGSADLSLIRVMTPLAPGARLLVRFDGEGRVDGRTLHAPTGITPDAASGAVELIDRQDDVLDRIAWGDGADAVDRDTDDLLSDAPPPGRTIGRPPGATLPLSPSQWVVYAPADTTPGADNPLPRVDQLVPMDGDILTGPSVALNWYPVAGAATYRVQIARDDAFGAPTLDRVVSTPEITMGTWPAGRYSWRVQAIGRAGQLAAFSATAHFALAGRGSSSIVSSAVPALAVRPISQAQPPPNTPSVVLGVPLISQHKDTQLLQLENREQFDTHGWDLDHQDYDPHDPSDAYNCVLASVAMMNRFFGGNLSQDRIAYEVQSRNAQAYAPRIISAPNMSGFQSRRTAAQIQQLLKEDAPGPERDFVYGDRQNSGLNTAQIIAALIFAFGPGARVNIFSTADEIWNAVTTEIDAGRPVIVVAKTRGTVGNVTHAMVAKGHEVANGQRLVVLNNPARQAEVRRSVDSPTLIPQEVAFYFLPARPVARRQEPSVTVDTDGDGVYDFDETERFFTNPRDRDSDRDGVEDKQDIASGVFDARYGYAAHSASPRGRDFDADGLPTERDRDSDDGGCRDGVEDADQDGDRGAHETWNFDDLDDECGDINGRIVWTESHRQRGPLRTFRDEMFVVIVKLKPETAGEMGPLVDDGSRYRFHAVSVAELPQVQVGACHPIGRTSVSSRGRFDTPGTEIGGNQSSQEVVIGANADGSGRGTADWCLWSGSAPADSSVALPDCVGKREPGPGATYTFDCTTPPATSADTEILLWSVKGRVTLAPHGTSRDVSPIPIEWLLRGMRR